MIMMMQDLSKLFRGEFDYLVDLARQEKSQISDYSEMCRGRSSRHWFCNRFARHAGPHVALEGGRALLQIWE